MLYQAELPGEHKTKEQCSWIVDATPRYRWLSDHPSRDSQTAQRRFPIQHFGGEGRILIRCPERLTRFFLPRKTILDEVYKPSVSVLRLAPIICGAESLTE